MSHTYCKKGMFHKTFLWPFCQVCSCFCLWWALWISWGAFPPLLLAFPCHDYHHHVHHHHHNPISGQQILSKSRLANVQNGRPRICFEAPGKGHGPSGGAWITYHPQMSSSFYSPSASSAWRQHINWESISILNTWKHLTAAEDFDL